MQSEERAALVIIHPHAASVTAGCQPWHRTSAAERRGNDVPNAREKGFSFRLVRNAEKGFCRQAHKILCVSSALKHLSTTCGNGTTQQRQTQFPPHPNL